jgi:hypothetical protein
MKVRFARWLAGFFTATGVVMVAVAMMLLSDSPDGAVPLLVAGLVMLAIGGLYFGPLPYLVVRESEVVVPVLFGPQGRVAIERGDRLRIDGGRLVVVRPDGRRDKVPAYRSMAHPTDWEAMIAKVVKAR